jgi:O-antigen/teichoic acid export membrane protein
VTVDNNVPTTERQSGENVPPSVGSGIAFLEVPDAPAAALDRREAGWDLLHGPKNYVALLGAQVTGSLLSLASVGLVTHYLGAGGYGGVVALIAAAQIVMLLAINWTGLTVARYGCEEFVRTGKIASSFWTRLVILLPNLVLVVATTPLWLPRLSEVLHLPPHVVWLVLSLLIVNAAWIHVQQALQGVKLLRLQGWLLALERSLIFFTICWLAFSGGISVWRVVCAYVFGPLGASVVGLFRLRKLIWPVGVDVSLLKRMLRFSLPIIPVAFIGYLSTYYLDALFISHFLTHEELGVYAVVYQLTGLTQQLPVLAGTLLMPLFITLQTGKQQSRTARFIHEVLPPLTLLWTLGCALVAWLGWYLLPMMFGAKFQHRGTLLWPLMTASAFAGPWLMGYGPITTTTSKTYLIMIAATFGACANVFLDWVLIPRFGLLGCAWATSVASGIYLIIIFHLVHWRIVLRRTWTLQATLPIAVGSLYASVFEENIKAFGLTVIVSAVIAMAHRESVIKAVRTIVEYGRFGSYTRIGEAREAD